jgi:hypothetical protein
MDNLERQLKNLPRKRLSLRADMRIKSKLYILTWKKYYSGFALPNLSKLRLVPITASILLVILATSIPAYAYSSPSVTKGTPLYPIKRVIENAQIAISSGPANKAKTYAIITQRRLDEARYISLKNANSNIQASDENKIAETIDEALKFDNQAFSESEKLEDNQASYDIKGYISGTRSDNVSVIADIAQSVGVKANDRTLIALASAFGKFENIKRLPANLRKSTTSEEEIQIQSASSTPPPQINSITDKETHRIRTTIDKVRTKIMGKNKNKTMSNGTGEQTGQDIRKNPSVEKSNLNATTTDESAAKLQSAEINAALKSIKDNALNMEKDLGQKDINHDEAKILIDRINGKIKNLETAVKNKKYDGLDGLLSETKGLTDYGEYFIKNKTDEKTGTEKNNPPKNNSNKINSKNERDR